MSILPENVTKTSGFPTFSGDIETEDWHEMG